MSETLSQDCVTFFFRTKMHVLIASKLINKSCGIISFT